MGEGIWLYKAWLETRLEAKLCNKPTKVVATLAWPLWALGKV